MPFTPPLHIREGIATPWRLWFAWRPVRTEQRQWTWLRYTYRRRFFPPLWFCPPAPHDGWWEYSNVRQSYWESCEDPPPRSCTCHPDDNPPQPCPQQYALSECRRVAAALSAGVRADG